MISVPKILKICMWIWCDVCLCMRPSACLHMCFLMDAKENARPLPNHLNFCDRVCHWARTSPFWLHSLSSEMQGSGFLLNHPRQCRGYRHFPLSIAFTWLLRIQAQGPMLTQLAVHQHNHFPSFLIMLEQAKRLAYHSQPQQLPLVLSGCLWTQCGKSPKSLWVLYKKRNAKYFKPYGGTHQKNIFSEIKETKNKINLFARYVWEGV